MKSNTETIYCSGLLACHTSRILAIRLRYDIHTQAVHPQLSHLSHSTLLELKVREVIGAVGETHYQLSTLACPPLVSLPYVGVGVGHGIIGQPTTAGGHHLLNVIHGSPATTGNGLRERIPCGQDVEPEVATQAELHGDTLPGFDLIEDWQIVDGREEAGEGILHGDTQATIGRVARSIAGRAGDRSRAYVERGAGGWGTTDREQPGAIIRGRGGKGDGGAPRTCRGRDYISGTRQYGRRGIHNRDGSGARICSARIVHHRQGDGGEAQTVGARRRLCQSDGVTVWVKG